MKPHLCSAQRLLVTSRSVEAPHLPIRVDVAQIQLLHQTPEVQNRNSETLRTFMQTTSDKSKFAGGGNNN